jgi:hypothetical protein
MGVATQEIEAGGALEVRVAYGVDFVVDGHGKMPLREGRVW